MVDRVDFEEITDSQTWTDVIELVDDDADEPIATEPTAMVISVSDPRTGAIVMTASLANGKITPISPGAYRFRFESGEVEKLCAGQIYDVGGAATLDGDDVPLFVGTIPVIDGVVP
ncbi:hypothetical protein RA307_04715 [Xanthobacteraceae bacterium Astr-EGSB]|uniref:hypothetical protein n=1 Tax=Astrobacterium formosum TaxID=3069710 RepID=UPI0027B55880|nr:hypothetical protein [Xanthobacteraceae bacterium Astr-EGSB]